MSQAAPALVKIPTKSPQPAPGAPAPHTCTAMLSPTIKPDSLRRSNGGRHRRAPRSPACQHSVMGVEVTQVLCPECRIPGTADPGATRWQCGSCGNGFFLRRCAACRRVSFVDGLQGFRMPWPCQRCGQFNRDFNQNQDPAAATVADLAAELAADLGSSGPARSADEPAAGGQPDPAPPPDSSPWPAHQESADAPPSGRRLGRFGLWATVAIAGSVAVGVALTMGSPPAAGMPAGQTDPGSGGAQRPVQVTVGGGVGTIDFQGVPGQLAITGTGTRSGPVSLTGQVHGSGRAPVIETRVDRSASVLVVSIRCASAAPCTENLRLAVPAGTGATVRQPGGQVTVSGLSGPLSITAANADVSASGLSSPSLTAAITSGQLSATFTAAPDEVSVTLTSAQARLVLPAGVAYRVAQQVTSGYVNVGIPTAATATRTVTARINSGELDVQSSERPPVSPAAR